ncbi:MAG TPA: glycosyltransferase family 4 protein [Thermoflexales bacterium]|nr:glycosyltransferase family 4 protein [Thermoflexales bacterium]HQY25520.1 glycosyltransferase family 4 protein [Thermoflexales bacterium]
MRVVMVSKAFVVDAYQRKCELIAEADPDLELTLVTPPSWRWGARVSTFKPAHVRGYAVVVAPIALNGSFHLHWYRGLGGLIRRLQPDIAHIDEEPYNMATWLAFRAARSAGARPLFFTWQNLTRAYPPPFRWFERSVLRDARWALAGNAAAAAVIGAKGYRGPTTVVPQFGVDEEIYRPPAGRHSDRFVVGYAGRLDPEKGVDTLIEACAPLREVEVQIAGAGPERERLGALAERLAMTSRTHFLGSLDTAAMVAFYQGLNAFVLPSRSRPNWVEQFGRVLIEAMACNVPVLGSRSGEIPNVIGDAGALFPEGDISALSDALRTLLGSPDAARAIGQRGRERAVAHFSMRRIALDTVRVYREMRN